MCLGLVPEGPIGPHFYLHYANKFESPPYQHVDHFEIRHMLPPVQADHVYHAAACRRCLFELLDDRDHLFPWMTPLIVVLPDLPSPVPHLFQAKDHLHAGLTRNSTLLNAVRSWFILGRDSSLRVPVSTSICISTPLGDAFPLSVKCAEGKAEAMQRRHNTGSRRHKYV
ncbi:hypothetical protein MAR_025029 [Mya arenaria]|uniref:Uncharacterized protein n=1 Tax=Mya arenaria TaxID=6604 RepID=A0ABY7DVL4_MYAAR|nr:hypothetical protein MAR_025029 [Mya arenaria]